MDSDEALLEAWPGVRIDRDNIEYYRALLDRRLVVARCRDCRTWHHPPRSVCPRCWSRSIGAEPVSGRGTVAFSTIVHGRRGGSAGGRLVAAVELDEQEALRIAALVVEADQAAVTPGTEVELTWLEREGRPVPAFRPVAGSPAAARATAADEQAVQEGASS
ncbi:MAG: zinc ribbon domain-containing protein [Acidimicrobiia bacterium]|nr:zinc ribbon domain-containing protein [Acidimicrobiia bacterium]